MLWAIGFSQQSQWSCYWKLWLWPYCDFQSKWNDIELNLRQHVREVRHSYFSVFCLLWSVGSDKLVKDVGGELCSYSTNVWREDYWEFSVVVYQRLDNKRSIDFEGNGYRGSNATHSWSRSLQARSSFTSFLSTDCLGSNCYHGGRGWSFKVKICSYWDRATTLRVARSTTDSYPWFTCLP